MSAGAAVEPIAISSSVVGSQLCKAIVDEVEKVFRGNRHAVQLVLTTILARGHVLFEDVPGVGKTTLARAFAHVLGASHNRIQFASDLMPADIVGVGIFNTESRHFEFKQGPIFCNVLLADEINRTTPRTQSALLEAMAEQHVTVDGTTHALPPPFIVLATQNPREFHGTYPLPESQLDRFLMRLSVGYPSAEIERSLIKNHGAPLGMQNVNVVATPAKLLALIDATAQVHVADEVLSYLHKLVAGTRTDRKFELGLSTRAAIGFYRAVQARAMVSGRDFATPDDVRNIFVPIAAHRVIAAGATGANVDRVQVEAALRGIIESVAPPA
jgi:MoxR-like ATPase